MSEDDRVMPKVAIRTVLDPSMGRDEPRTVYDVEFPNKSISGGAGYNREIIGYVETAPYSSINRVDSIEELLGELEAESQYYWMMPQRLTPEETTQWYQFRKATLPKLNTIPTYGGDGDE